MNDLKISLSGGTARLLICAVAAYLVTAIYYYKLQFLTPYLPENDGFYHIKMAYLMRTQGIMKSFPWAQIGMWRDHFFDKEFLFHYILQAFTFGDLQYGGKLAAVLLGALGPFALYVALKRSKVILPSLYLVLLLSSGGYFLFRDLVPRPQILSIFFSIVAMYHITRRQSIRAGVVSFLYTLSYTASFIVIIYAAIFSGISRRREKKMDRRVLVAVVVGFLAGCVIHPNFPNNFRAWYVQNFSVLISAWKPVADLHLGGELSQIDPRELVSICAAVFFPYFGAIICSAIARLRTDATQVTLLIVSFGFFIMTLLSKRFVEYWAPFSLWYAALVFTEAYRERRFPFGAIENIKTAWARYAAIGGIAVVIGGILVFLFMRSNTDVSRMFAGVEPSSAAEPAAWIRANVPAGETIYTCDWDDAPELFFYDSIHHYLLFLDPNYLYRQDPKLWRLWNATSNGLNTRLHETLMNDFNARYGYCTSDFMAINSQIKKDTRFEIVYSSDHNYIFKRLSEDEWRAKYPEGRVAADAPFETDWLYSQAVEYDFEAGPADNEQWKKVPKDVVDGNVIDLKLLKPGPAEYACRFMKQEIVMNNEISGHLLVGSDDGCAVFLNGRLIYQNPSVRGFSIDGDRINLDLPKGKNSVVVKVCNMTGDWKFAARYLLPHPDR